MARENSKTIKEIKYKGYLIKVKKDGECFIFKPKSKKVMTWAEHIEHAKCCVRASIRCQKTREKWELDDKYLVA